MIHNRLELIMYSLTAVLILASIPAISVCQTDCDFPTSSNLEDVIAEVLNFGDNPTPAVVSVTNFHPVCLAHGQERDRYRFLSVVVEYTCSNSGNCPNGNHGSVVEQFESQCNGGTWTSQVLASSGDTCTQNPTANFSTTTRGDCFLCSSPEKASDSSLTTDNLTHCVRKYRSNSQHNILCVAILQFRRL